MHQFANKADEAEAEYSQATEQNGLKFEIKNHNCFATAFNIYCSTTTL